MPATPSRPPAVSGSASGLSQAVQHPHAADPVSATAAVTPRNATGALFGAVDIYDWRVSAAGLVAHGGFTPLFRVFRPELLRITFTTPGKTVVATARATFRERGPTRSRSSYRGMAARYWHTVAHLSLEVKGRVRPDGAARPNGDCHGNVQRRTRRARSTYPTTRPLHWRLDPRPAASTRLTDGLDRRPQLSGLTTRLDLTPQIPQPSTSQ
jgi:hypothetical protein